MARLKRYQVRVWWTTKAAFDQIVDLHYVVKATSDKLAIRAAHDAFKASINKDSIKTTHTVQFRVLNPDGKAVEDSAVFV